MGNCLIENSLKRYLKRKVKITLGFVVAFMITGAVSFSAETQEPEIITIDKSEINVNELKGNSSNKPTFILGDKVTDTLKVEGKIVSKNKSGIGFNLDLDGKNLEAVLSRHDGLAKPGTPEDDEYGYFENVNIIKGGTVKIIDDTENVPEDKDYSKNSENLKHWAAVNTNEEWDIQVEELIIVAGKSGIKVGNSAGGKGIVHYDLGSADITSKRFGVYARDNSEFYIETVNFTVDADEIGILTEGDATTNIVGKGTGTGDLVVLADSKCGVSLRQKNASSKNSLGSGKVVIKNFNFIKINSEESSGISINKEWLKHGYNKGTIDITGNKVEVSGKEGIYIWGKGDSKEDSTVNVTGNESLKITATGTAKNAVQIAQGGSVNLKGSTNLLLEGNINITGRTDLQANINADFTSEASYLNGYIKTGNKAESNIVFSNGAKWNNTGDSSVTNLTLNNGITDMTYAGKQTITINNITGNDGTFIMDISTNDIEQKGKETDFLKIGNSENGSKHYIGIGESSLDGLKNYDFENGNSEKAIWIADTNENITFEGKEYQSLENIFDYTLKLGTDVRNDANENGTNWYVTGLDKEENIVTETITDDMSYLYNAALSRLELDTIHKRLGEIRNYNDTHGVWFRTSAGKQDSDVSNSSFENDYYMLQVGYDKKKISEKGEWFTGFAVSRRENDVDYRNGNGESENIGISLYKSFSGKNDSYFDLIGRYTFIDTDFTAYNENNESMKADYDTWAGTLSAEYGKKFSDKNDKWYLTPHAQLNYTYIDGADYTTSSHVKVSQDDIDSLIGRVGLYAGKDFEKSSHYLKLSVLHEFMGDYGANIKGADSSLHKNLNGEDTWTEVGLGGNFQIGDSETTHIYYDVERTFGSDFETQWQGTIGIRLSFDKISDLFAKPVSVPLTTVKADNYFDFDKTELKENGKEVIKQASEIINNKNYKGTLLIEGHTDWTGSEEYNQLLSEKRAKAVEKEFKANIKNSENIKYETKGYGETKPIADNKTAEGRAKNRRVDIRYYK